MQVGNQEISENLETYSSKLKMDEADYTLMRGELLTSFAEKRSAERDLQWYLKRLSLRTFFVIKDLYTNRKKYNKKFKKYLK